MKLCCNILSEYLGLGPTPASSHMWSYSHPNLKKMGCSLSDGNCRTGNPLMRSLGPKKRYLERVPYYVSSVLPNCTESKYLYVCKWRPPVNAVRAGQFKQMGLKKRHPKICPEIDFPSHVKSGTEFTQLFDGQK